jgi:hypothetical protein
MVCRTFTDPLVWSNVIFIYVGYIAYNNKIYELSVLSILTFILSGLYHLYHELKYEMVEGIIVKLFFIYGLIQIYYAPTVCLKYIELLCALLTSCVYLTCGICRIFDYDTYHVLQHLIVQLWIYLVASYHKTLL